VGYRATDGRTWQSYKPKGWAKKLNEESRGKIETSIQKERHLSLVPDGWQNIRGLSVINVMLANPNSRIFYKSIETGNTFVIWL
jgi:hypothetical protein